MHLLINGQSVEFPADSGDASITVERLLREIKPAGHGADGVRGACAVEINRRVVPRREHGTRMLADGDVIEIVTLVGGG